jgi:predicted unusual protein kinase regulating ubiquinone biosynthesis (AarF/ABC1/UbiB family)
MSENEVEENQDGNALIKRGNKLKCLADTFQSYGGVLAKLSQIVCFENQENSVFSDCKPYSRDKTIKYLKTEFKLRESFFKNVKYIDFNPFKSGSVGQVHKGIYKDDKEIVMKVQYVGLKEQMETDLFILDKVFSYMYTFTNLSNAMVDIKTKLNEELDYTLEFCNQHNMYNIWEGHNSIKIAELISDLSNDKLLTMYYIEAESLPEFIENSTQEQRNHIGSLIIEFIFTNLYREGIFYSDIHYGNFLIKDKSILYVMDFGCLHDINDVLLTNLKNIHKSILDDNKEIFYKTVENMGIINSEISTGSKDYIYEYFKLQLEPWTSESFEFTEEWLKKSVYKEPEFMKEWELPNNMVYLNKICYGFPHVLTKLNLQGSFLPLIKKLLN